MSLNSQPVSARTKPIDAAITANGSYTLPRYAFIPHPSLQVISTGAIPGPTTGGISAAFVAPPQTRRPYPISDMPSIYGVRAVTVKRSA